MWPVGSGEFGIVPALQDVHDIARRAIDRAEDEHACRTTPDAAVGQLVIVVLPRVAAVSSLHIRIYCGS